MLVSVTVPVLVEFRCSPPVLLTEMLVAVVDILLLDVPIVPEPVDKASVVAVITPPLRKMFPLPLPLSVAVVAVILPVMMIVPALASVSVVALIVEPTSNCPPD